MHKHKRAMIAVAFVLIGGCSGINTAQLACNALRSSEQQAQILNSTGYQATAIEQSPSCVDYQRLRQQEIK